MLALALFFSLMDDASPYNLPIGRPGTSVVESGRLTELKTGKFATVDDIAKASDRHLFVFLGEEHATEPDQAMHAEIVQALIRRGRHVIVGLEMYQRPKQPVLDQWTAGSIEEGDFLTQSDWKGQWGYPFAFYRPLFDTIRRFKLPLVGLNVPRDWVRSVGRGGFEALTAEQKAQLPDPLGVENPNHRQVFNALMGGHPMSGTSGEHMYSAQVLWDEAMADSALKYLDAHRPDNRTVFVVIAGSGHVMYGQGINYRIAKRKGGEGITVVMAQSDDPLTVSNGLADFVFVTPMPRKQ
ncbi:MAG: ChaN family lipoprotein [Fimbriimonas sp.]|nr:ChaN family lipoprotein [Fimbriimonas sp.]